MADQEKKKMIEIDEDACIGCGACEASAEEYFELAADGKAKVKKQYDEKDIELIEEAIDGCPVQAIKIVEK